MFSVAVTDNAERTRHVYHFHYFLLRHELRLYRYELQQRPSRRHNWGISECWDLIASEQSTCRPPTLPDDVAKRALDEFVSTLTVVA